MLGFPSREDLARYTGTGVAQEGPSKMSEITGQVVAGPLDAMKQIFMAQTIGGQVDADEGLAPQEEVIETTNEQGESEVIVRRKSRYEGGVPQPQEQDAELGLG